LEGARTHKRSNPRAATLLEMLLVVTILGVVAALAAPNMLPAVAGHRLFATTIEIAGYVDMARRRAVTEGRCYRVRVAGDTLVTEGRDSSDCVNLGRDGWRTSIATMAVAPQVTLTIEALTTPASVTAADHSILFRPNGRLYGDGDLVTSDDGARIVLVNGTANETRSVVIQATGRVCLRNNGPGTAPALGATGALTCN
jgi:Tfp pilus assembly protein FimT